MELRPDLASKRVSDSTFHFGQDTADYPHYSQPK